MALPVVIQAVRWTHILAGFTAFFIAPVPLLTTKGGKTTSSVATQAMMELYPADEWTPEAAAALLSREINLWSDVIRTNDIPAQ